MSVQPNSVLRAARSVACCLILTVCGQTEGANITLAVSGDSTPDGSSQYDSFRTPLVNNLGQVGTVAGLNNGRGVYRLGGNGPDVEIVRSGDSAGNGNFSTFKLSSLNNSGQAAIRASLSGTSGGNTDNFGLYVGNGTVLNEYVRKGNGPVFTLATAGLFDAKYSDLESSSIILEDGPTLNDSGVMAYWGEISGHEPIINGTRPVTFSSVFTANANNQRIVAKQRTAAPAVGGGTQGTFDRFLGNASGLGAITTQINNAGNVAFRADTDNPDGRGLFWTKSTFFSTTQKAIALTGQTNFPGAPGVMNTFGSQLDMNDAGKVAFDAQLAPPGPMTAADQAIYIWDSALTTQPGAHGLTEIVRSGDAITNSNSTIRVPHSSGLGLNNRDQVAFMASLDTNGLFDGAGIFRGTGQITELFVQSGDLTPDGQRRFDSFSGPTINDSGQVAFETFLHDAAGQFAGDGIYLGDGIGLVEVMRSGRSLAGSIVDRVSFDNKAGLNELGQVAYRATFTDGREGLFLYTLEDVIFRTSAGGAWDDPTNWTLSTQPASLHNITIDTNPGAVVMGPSVPTTVKSLSVGTGDNGVSELRLNAAGPISTLDGATINAGGRLSGAGAIDGPLTLMPGSELLVLSGDELTIDASGFDNRGVVNIVGGKLSFAGQGVNDTAGQIVAVGAMLNFDEPFANVGSLSLVDSVVNGSVVNEGLVVLTGVNTFADPVSGTGSFADNGRVVFANGYSPGESAALVEFGGDVTLDDANRLELHLGGHNVGSQYDALRIDGEARLGGELEVSRLGVFEPELGDEFKVIEALAGVTGEFASQALPTLFNPLLRWDVAYNANDVTLRVLSALEGDFNGDGIVDTGDYTVWRNSLGQIGSGLAADGDLSGEVDAADYTLWKQNFGASLATAGSASVSVPEPASLILLLAIGLLSGCRLRFSSSS